MLNASEVLPSQQLSSPDVSRPATSTEAVSQYLTRRDFVEKHFLDNKPLDQTLNIEGANIRVLSAFCDIPADLTVNHPQDVDTKPVGTAGISIYVPGLFEAANPNMGNHPLESKLAGALQTGADAVMMVKAEGLDEKAYENCGQVKVSQASLEVVAGELRNYLDKHPDVRNLELKVVGYSEGSTQAASLTARLIEMVQNSKEQGTPLLEGKLDSLQVKEYVSLGGGGLSGAAEQNAADPLTSFMETNKSIAVAQQRQKAEQKNKEGMYANIEGTEFPKTVSQEPLAVTPDVQLARFLVRPELIAAYEDALKRSQPVLKDDIANIAKWAGRFATTGFPNVDMEEPTAQMLSGRVPGGQKTLEALQRFAGTFQNVNLLPVPYGRLKALFSVNHDYETILGSQDTRLVVVAENFDLFFPPAQVEDRLVQMIKACPNPEQAAQKTFYVNTDATHDLEHNNPNGLAYLLNLLERKQGWNDRNS